MRIRNLLASVGISALAIALATAARADQYSVTMPTSGPHTMADFVTNYLNPALQSLQSCNNGASAPTNGTGGSPKLGQCWLNTSASPNLMEVYDGSNWRAWLALNGSSVALASSITSSSLTSFGLNPSFAFASGGVEVISFSSTNTGNTDQIALLNSGTSSNSATVAQVAEELICSSCYLLETVYGGAAPVSQIYSGAGMTGGLAITTAAGALGLSGAAGVSASYLTVTGAFAATGLVTNADLVYPSPGNILYNVQEYGIVGDNSTDNGPSATSGALYNLYTTVVANGGGIIYFPCNHFLPTPPTPPKPAVYRFSYFPTIAADGVSIVGESRYCVTLAPLLTGGYDITLSGHNGDDLSNFTLSPVNTKTGGSALYIDDAARNSINRLWIHAPYTAVQIDAGLVNANQTANKFSDVLIDQCVNTAFDIGPASATQVNEVFVQNTTVAFCQNGMYLEYVNGLYVSNYSSYSGVYSVVLNARSGKAVSGLFFDGLIADSASSTALIVSSGGSGENGDTYVTNSQFDSNYYGIYVAAGAQMRGLYVTNSGFTVNSHEAVLIGLVSNGHSTNTWCTSASCQYNIDAQFTGNNFCFNYTSSFGGGADFNFNSQGLIFEDNVSGACGYQMYVQPIPPNSNPTPNNTNYGVVLGANVNDAIVVNNRFPGQVSGTIYNGSSNTNIVTSPNYAY